LRFHRGLAFRCRLPPLPRLRQAACTFTVSDGISALPMETNFKILPNLASPALAGDECPMSFESCSGGLRTPAPVFALYRTFIFLRWQEMFAPIRYRATN
jgi:hypothetical protein